MQTVPDLKLQRADNLKATILPDGYLAIFSSTTNFAYTLPPMAAIAWEFFDGTNTIEDVIKEVKSNVDSVDETTLRQDLQTLIEALRKNEFLIDVADSSQ